MRNHMSTRSKKTASSSAAADITATMPNVVAIELLIKAYYTPIDSDWDLDPNFVGTSDTAIHAWNFLKSQNLVDPDNSITAKGKAWVEHIRKIPLPVETTTYVIPKIVE